MWLPVQTSRHQTIISQTYGFGSNIGDLTENGKQKVTINKQTNNQTNEQTKQKKPKKPKKTCEKPKKERNKPTNKPTEGPVVPVGLHILCTLNNAPSPAPGESGSKCSKRLQSRSVSEPCERRRKKPLGSFLVVFLGFPCQKVG